MSISIFQSHDPSVCTIRVTADGKDYDFIEVRMDLLALVNLISDLQWEAVKMHQFGREAIRAEQRALKRRGEASKAA